MMTYPSFLQAGFSLLCAERTASDRTMVLQGCSNPLNLFKFKHAQLMYKQTGAGIRLPTPEQAGGTCVSH